MISIFIEIKNEGHFKMLEKSLYQKEELHCDDILQGIRQQYAKNWNINRTEETNEHYGYFLFTYIGKPLSDIPILPETEVSGRSNILDL